MKRLPTFKGRFLTTKFHVDALRAQHEYCPLGRRSARISDRTQIGVTLMIYQQQTAFGREHMALSSSSIAAIEISSALKPVLILMTNKMNNFDHHVLAAKR